MVQFHHPEAIPVPPRASQPSQEAPPKIEDRNWYASSRDLARGLVVMEFSDTLPLEFPDP
jgi:hypothetical protein